MKHTVFLPLCQEVMLIHSLCGCVAVAIVERTVDWDALEQGFSQRMQRRAWLHGETGGVGVIWRWWPPFASQLSASNCV